MSAEYLKLQVLRQLVEIMVESKIDINTASDLMKQLFLK